MFRGYLSGQVLVSDNVPALTTRTSPSEIVQLSVETSATAMTVSTIVMPDMSGFWREAAELKAVMLRDQGSDIALRAIACGAFDPGNQYPFDAKTRKVTQFVANEILKERAAAASHDRDVRAEARVVRRSKFEWLWRLLNLIKG